MRSADEICKDAAHLFPGIVAAAILERGSLRGAHIKLEGAQARMHGMLERLAAQAEMLLATVAAEADYFGKAHYLMSHADKADVFMFPVWLNGRKMLLGIQVTPPYPHDDLVARLRQYIGETTSTRQHH